MHVLALPPPTSLPLTPFGRRQEPGNGLVKFSSQFSPGRSGQYSYPSPPMSDSQSPARRSAQLVESEGQPYPTAVSEARRREGIPPPPLILDPRAATSTQSILHQRPLYPGESQQRGQPLHYPPTGREVEHHSYGGVQLPQNYAYPYPGGGGGGVPSFLGAQGPGPQVQPTAIIAPPPLRPNKPARRTKAHVASACVNCKKAHLSCDVQRPCGRCVASGKQDSCKDVQHKKRGRPRLRDDKEFGRSDEGRPTPTQLLGALPVPGSEAYSQQTSFPSSHRATDPLRVLRRPTQASEGIPNIHPQPIAQSAGGRPTSVGSYGRVSSSPYLVGPSLTYQALPVAFLNLDLVVLKSNQAFQDLVPFLGNTRGKNLSELLESRQTDVLQRLRNELRDEKDEREPTFMPPITQKGQDLVQSVAENDVDQVSQGYTDRTHLLNFRLPSGQYQSLQTQIRLAKTSLYFVTLVVHTPPRPTGPPLLTQQLAPPTPVRASQTLSAPTTAPARDFGPYPVRPPSSASSAPTSPYFNFSSVRTSLPQAPPLSSTSSYGSSQSYQYSPTAGPEQGYFPTIQPPSQPGAYPSPYPPVSRSISGSMGSPRGQEPLRDSNRPPRLEGLHLPPIRTAPPPPLPSPLGQEFGESSRERVRQREASPSTTAERVDTPDTGKRRRLNIHEVLE
ncbi:uncharacterized protein BDR25DRAFT_221412 [Lindgomyces ingoldianus]|uniref:Uncharacterized protein n=1 Tax=Lindgomyces ingoldianus TaxID=673940 RepID=A0ACB6R1D8_9PLEO|nr:uncharacterized protein BDR25DRAFT_221412 [Lindgomyces ingoldianus]KAF2472147.1 hypothetical protein BDR25DRAFT_221412 [Lindgomyces ingoldianus]